MVTLGIMIALIANIAESPKVSGATASTTMLPPRPPPLPPRSAAQNGADDREVSLETRTSVWETCQLPFAENMCCFPLLALKENNFT